MNQPIFSILISAGDRPQLLRRLIDSLNAQALPGAAVEILIDRPSTSESVARLRNRLYRAARGTWVLFVDEDAELPDAQFLARVQTCLQATGGCVGGLYLGGEDIYQRAYNALANFWLRLHRDQGRALPVAGNFALHKISAADDFPFAEHAVFGGEEISLRHNLLRHGLEFHLREELSLRHNGRKSARGFFARALCHGRGESQPVDRKRAMRSLAHDLKRQSLAVAVLMLSYMLTVYGARLLWRRTV